MAHPSDIALGLSCPDDWGVATFEASVTRLNATPPVYEMGAGEEKGLSFSFDDVMIDDEIPDDSLTTYATVELIDLITGESYDDGIVGDASVSAATVTQLFGDLVAGREYLATVEVTTTQGNTYEQGLRISCPY
jgi:hypothetical protein